jgi:hypothetical protein
VTAPLTPEQHAERIREPLLRAGVYTADEGTSSWVEGDALASLAALLALLADAEARAAINEHQCDDMTASALDAYARVEAAEARVAELETAWSLLRAWIEDEEVAGLQLPSPVLAALREPSK